jgi:hypothetical protein
MLPLAIVLVLTTTPAPSPPTLAPPLLPPPLVERGLRPPCPDIDRGFVRFVTPPEGRGPLWPISRLDPRYLDLGPAVRARGPQALRPMACPRLQPVAGI